jgi:hypothetical protein
MASFQERIEIRRKTYKKCVDGEDVRRKREDETVQLRKQKREEQMSKKRLMQDEREEAENVPQSSNAANLTDTGMAPLVQHLAQGGEGALAVITEIRKRLARWADPPVQEAVDCGVVPVVTHYLKGPDLKLQFEAAWVLTNIASGNTHQTQAVVNSGAVPYFVQLLGTGSMEIREQALWALANIAGDSTKNRDGVLEYSPLQPITSLIVESESNGKLHMLRNATWALGNLCRGKPSPDVEKIQGALPFLGCLIKHSDRDVIIDTLWALSYISDGSNDRIQKVIDCEAVPYAVELLSAENPKVLQPAVRLVGNIATGNNHQTDLLIQLGVLSKLPPLLYSKKPIIRKETLWLLSNITAGTPEQIQAVFDANLFSMVVDLSSTGDAQVRKEGLFALANAAHGWEAHLGKLHELGTINVLVSSIDIVHDCTVVLAILEALRVFLAAGRVHADKVGGPNPFCSVIEEAGGLEKLEGLQSDQNESVYKKAESLLATYFELEEGDEVDAPAGTVGGFDFSA